MKHTPGPWFYTKETMKIVIHTTEYNNNVNEALITEEDSDYTIAGIWSLDAIDQANAHLIATAPDLLIALEYLVRIEPKDKIDSVWIEKAKLTIAKARGEL